MLNILKRLILVVFYVIYGLYEHPKRQDFVYNEADSPSINEVLTKAKRQSLMLISISIEGDS